MDTDEVLLSQLVGLGVGAAGPQPPANTPLVLSRLQPEELYSILLEGVRLIYKISGQAARDKEDGVKPSIALLPKKLPKSTSSRFSNCEGLAKELVTYGSDCSDYNAIMYPTPETNKSLLKWLLDTLLRCTEEERQRQIQSSTHAAGGGEAKIPKVQASLSLLKKQVESTRSNNRGPIRKLAVQLPSQFRTTRLGSFGSLAETGHRDPFGSSVAAVHKRCAPGTDGFRAGLYNSVLERNASDLDKSGSLATFLATPLSTDSAVNADYEAKMNAISNSVFSQSSTSGASNKSRGKDTAKTSTQVAALFFDTNEQGLDPEAFQSRKRAEADAQAEVDALEAKELQAREKSKQREEEAESVRSALKAAKKEYAVKKAQLKALKALQDDMEQELDAWAKEDAANLASQRAERRAEVNRRLELLQLMNDAEANLKDLEEQLSKLGEQQEAARGDFIKKMSKVEAVREKLQEQLAAAGAGNDEIIRELRGQCKTLKDNIKQKTQEVRQLSEEYERCPKDIDRSKYLRYIFDMTGNMQRQQEEIDKVVKETNAAEAGIQKLNDEVKVIFEKLESTVYDKATTTSVKAGSSSSAAAAAAANDTFARDAFKKVVELRGAYNKLTELINERGQLKRETHEAEVKLAKLKRVVQQYDSAAVERDLQEAEKEIAAIEAYRKANS